jgi:GTP-binding protein EngB required for normal cell division
MIPAGNYLLIGRTGVGKSSLINTLAQASLAAVDYSYACTKAIASYAFDTPAGSYVLHDSPGFCEDDNPETDADYFSKIKDFIDGKTIESCDISLLFTIRLGSTRVRSEDHKVVEYLAELLLRFRLPVVLVATWADFTSSDQSVRRQLDLARIQYLAMIDKSLLELSDKKLCAAGFDGAYAVDNVSAAWMSSWKPLILKSNNFSALASYEAEVGHPVAFISNWISAGDSDSSALVTANKLNLLAARIENLTSYPFRTDVLLPDFLVVKPTGSSSQIDQGEFTQKVDSGECSYKGFVPYIYIDDDDLLSSIDELGCVSIKKFFGIQSLDAVELVLRRLSQSHAECCTLLRPIASTRGLSGHMCRHLVSLYAVKGILEDLYIILSQVEVSRLQHLTSSGAFLLEERIASFGTLLSSLYSLVGKAYLLDESIAFVEAGFHPPPFYQFGHVKKHFLNCIVILYVSVVFAEWALFPRPIEVFRDHYWPIYADDILAWITSSSPLYGYSELALNAFRSADWRAIVMLAMDCPGSMSCFLEDITRSLTRGPLLISESSFRALSETRTLGDDFAEVPF